MIFQVYNDEQFKMWFTFDKTCYTLKLAQFIGTRDSKFVYLIKYTMGVILYFKNWYIIVCG